MNSLRVACVVGARPNFIKMAALVREMSVRPGFEPVLIHTGQHFSHEMSAQLFSDLELPQPDIQLAVRNGSRTAQTAEIMTGLESVFANLQPDVVLVVGDVNSTLAAALVAAQLGLPIAHVEAGLRSFDWNMPEEINRIVTDALSSLLFASEPSGVANLLAEGVSQEKIFLVGNVMIDTLMRFRERALCSDIVDRLELASRGFVLATLHRPSNVDDSVQLQLLLGVLSEIGRDWPVVFPCHPRTRKRLSEFGCSTVRIRLVEPLGYLDFLRLQAEARLVLTDSGGIQEETTVLGVPCLTVRESTERPITIKEGLNQLVGAVPAKVLDVARRVLSEPMPPPRTPELWDGAAAGRILDVLEAKFVLKAASATAANGSAVRFTTGE